LTLRNPAGGHRVGDLDLSGVSVAGRKLRGGLDPRTRQQKDRAVQVVALRATGVYAPSAGHDSIQTIDCGAHRSKKSQSAETPCTLLGHVFSLFEYCEKLSFRIHLLKLISKTREIGVKERFSLGKRT
jgi:hypothetical protein